MSSAFKNFFITFAICLVVFGFLGFKFAYPWLNDMMNLSDIGEESSGETSQEISGDTSGDTSAPVSVPESNLDPNGDVFTAVILAEDSNGKTVNAVFIDANGKSKQFIYCPIPVSTKGVNEVGVTVPVSELYCNMTPDAVCKSVSALTGIETKYCLRINRENLLSIVPMIPGAYITLNEEISFTNPAYKDLVLEEGASYPDDYYINITQVDGKVLLNEKQNGKTKLEWLLTYSPNSDGSEYNALYSQICKSVIRQFFENESATKSTEVMAKLIQNCETNLTVNDAGNHLATIFSYNDYQRHELNLPANWETAVAKLRELDGSY